jgi:predicted  nucleic acid-binding Zn-ribbon protein
MKKDKMQNYMYYSTVLKEPFETVEALAEAEEAYYAKQKAKEDAATQKKADAQKVEDAFKALNAARKSYKEDIATLTKEYAESMDKLKKAYELGTKDIKSKLATAEETYSEALKEFTAKYDQYHMTLKDGDFETTISSTIERNSKVADDILDIFKLFIL